MENQLRDASDSDLVGRFKEGAPEAMDEIVRRYADRLFNFGLKMCRQSEDAEDVTQETFLSAFRYLDGFRGETKLRNWLFKIAARACLKKRRKKKCEPDRELSLDALIPGEDGPVAYEIPDWSENPSDHLIRAELKERIEQAIAALPPKYRMVFNLRDIEGFSTEETAEIMGISTQLVKTRLHRARLFLRQAIAEDGWEEGAR